VHGRVLHQRLEHVLRRLHLRSILWILISDENFSVKFYPLTLDKFPFINKHIKVLDTQIIYVFVYEWNFKVLDTQII
jgi:hypothetical protein